MSAEGPGAPGRAWRVRDMGWVRDAGWAAVGLWAVLAVPVLVADPLGFDEPRPWWQQTGALVVLAVAAVLRRARPVTAFLLVASLSVAAAAPALLTAAFGPSLAAFALLMGLWADRTGPALAAFGALLALGGARIAVRNVDPVTEALVLVAALLFIVVLPWLGGRNRRQGRALAEAGWARAQQLEREQRIVADRARLRERARIAQDMHDSLGHELSLIALRAGALQVARDLPPRHRAATAELRSAAAEATDRLHAIIGVLREPDEPLPLTPAPTDSVESLVRRAAASGMPVRMVDAVPDPEPPPAAPGGAGAPAAPVGPAVRGEDGVPRAYGSARRQPRTPGEEAGAPRAYGPAGEGPDVLSPLAEQVARGVVQEALTNAAKHAPGAPVTVCAVRDPLGATVTVVSGPPRDAPVTVPGGLGLPGLRARVTALGGTFEAGRHGTDFRVHARIPGHPAPGPTPEPTPGPAAEPASGPAAEPASGPVGAARSPAGAVTASVRPPRRTLPAVVAVPAAGAVFLGGALAWYAYAEARTVLAPSVYAGLRPGTTLDALRAELPERAVPDPPRDRAPAVPAGADECRYYRADGELFTTVPYFRLCFDGGGVLIAKDVVPRATTGRVGPAPDHGARMPGASSGGVR
ncbi:sensor histidine kinase [Streptomyces uncialis]|uniref:ATP-binding protein n=1 Tax=Streptomyces uncialis TaxID=1048205 RepID=UPI00386342A9|nr:histidine kinase [Streptomyces uncialis]